MSFDYYKEKLSAERLRQAYEIAPPRVRQYLRSEIEFVKSRMNPHDTVVELGCGFGRVLLALADHAGILYGIDNSPTSIRLAKQIHADNVRLAVMDAVAMAFADKVFDLVVCIQNGISAFHVDPVQLVRESLRITRPGGRVLLSSYSDKFWADRLKWFELQAQHGLHGEIDYEATRPGRIVSRDGFFGTTYSADDFRKIVSNFTAAYAIHEIDESSLFCEIVT
ncbi:MAG: class I SAM-dependent methyltransferase [candidate division Zixibacteria bacterium]|nr:class I SAM-dependent methyltransferase [candidate division Zixibacteria bacterium]